MAKKSIDKNSLIIPVYLNEKIVLDMLAIIEDGFSMVSEVTSTHTMEKESKQQATVGIDAGNIISKLVKIQFEAEAEHGDKNNNADQTKREKVHTSVSLFSKLRTYLNENSLLTCSSKEGIDISIINPGDFIEIEGELQKNPMIDFFERFISIFKMADIFSDTPKLGNKKQANQTKNDNQKISGQISSFLSELNASGTIDFMVENDKGTVILSTQEQYLQNDNISELIGGKFRVLGKVIKIVTDQNGSIDLLRKTSLSILDDKTLGEVLTAFKSEELKQYKLPDVRASIKGPAMIIIPIAIYA